MVFGEEGFGVEGIDLRRSAVHEEVNDPFGFGGKVGGFGGEGIEAGGGFCGDRFPEAEARDHLRERHRGHAHPTFLEKVAPGEEAILEWKRMMVHAQAGFFGWINRRRRIRWRRVRLGRTFPKR